MRDSIDLTQNRTFFTRSAPRVKVFDNKSFKEIIQDFGCFFKVIVYPWNDSKWHIGTWTFGKTRHATILGGKEERDEKYHEETDRTHCHRCGGISVPWQLPYREICRHCTQIVFPTFGPASEFRYGLRDNQNQITRNMR